MKELLVATRNRGKFAELELLLRDDFRLYQLADFTSVPEVDENGATFLENAMKKAQIAATYSGKPSLADDSGLAVDVLGGLPGVHSARFAGAAASDSQNNERLLAELAGIPLDKRRAAFHCVIALYLPDGFAKTFCGTLSGIILDMPRGDGGFGYDPFFLVPEYGKTLAELPVEIKNRISHRGQALRGLLAFLKSGEFNF